MENSSKYFIAALPELTPAQKRKIKIYLVSLIFLVLTMILVGGLTRLTESGLSITQWKPITGALPPLSEAQWLEEFEQYKQIPQFEIMNPSMTLDGFKSIFWWEFFHRLLGRLIGLVIFIPLAVFTIKKSLPKPWLRDLWLCFFLALLQALMGWVMVKSGLNRGTSVDPLRLVTHLGLALSLLGMYLQLFLRASGESPRFNPKLWPLNVLLAAQIVFGAMTAGLRAGKIAPTFPTMNGHWFPPEEAITEPLIFHNPFYMQWLHRVFGTLLLIGAWVTFYYFMRKWKAPTLVRKRVGIFTGLITLQYLLGAAMVVAYTPIVMASVHQALGTIVFISAIFANSTQIEE